MDNAEHEYWCDREREAVLDSYPLDGDLSGQPSLQELKLQLAKDFEADIEPELTPEEDAEADDPLYDPFSNNYLTEDELMFDESYKPNPYLPDKVKQMMYYLFTERGWSVQRISQRFGVRAARVAVIINMKRTEPEWIAKGMYDEEADRLLTEMYADLNDQGFDTDDWELDHHLTPEKRAAKEEKRARQRRERVGTSGIIKRILTDGPLEENWAPNYDLGVNVAILKDEQMPDDVLPRWAVPASAPRLRMRPPVTPQPPREERGHSKSKWAILDTGCGPVSRKFIEKRDARRFGSTGGAPGRRNRKAPRRMRLVDYDGNVTAGTSADFPHRTWHANLYEVRRRAEDDVFDFNPAATAAAAGAPVEAAAPTEEAAPEATA